MCPLAYNKRWFKKKTHNAVIQDMKNLKAEVDLLKRTVQSLIYIKEEAKVDIKELKFVKI